MITWFLEEAEPYQRDPTHIAMRLLRVNFAGLMSTSFVRCSHCFLPRNPRVTSTSSYRKSFSNWRHLLNMSDLFASKSTRRWNDTDGRKRASAKCTKWTVSSVKSPECKDSVHVSIFSHFRFIQVVHPSLYLYSCPSPKGDESQRLHIPRWPQYPSRNPYSSCILYPQQKRGGV
jgi:hypothetical protein